MLKLQSNVSKRLLEGLITRVVGKDNETLRVVPQNKAVVSPALFSSGFKHCLRLVLFGWDALGYKAARATPGPPLLQQSPALAQLWVFCGEELPGPAEPREAALINPTAFLWVLKVSTVTGAHSQPPAQTLSSP